MNVTNGSNPLAVLDLVSTLLALLLVTGIAGCEPDRENPPRRPDILFVILETLRVVQIEANSEAPIELDPKMRNRLQSLGYGS